MSIQQTTGIAALQNVLLTAKAFQNAINRPDHLPGLVCMYGYSGWGKTYAAIWVANQTKAYFLKVQSIWTPKAFLISLAREMGLKTTGAAWQLLDRIAEHLAITGRPLVLDDCDPIVKKNGHYIELIRDLYEASLAPILMIGEEEFPRKVERHERCHNRFLEWVPAQPCNLNDAQTLADLYCPGVNFEPDLLDATVKQTQGVARRIVINLEHYRRYANTQGLDSLSLSNWNQPIETGDAPSARAKARRVA